MRVAGELQIKAPASGALVGEVRLVSKEHGTAGFNFSQGFEHFIQAVIAIHDAVDTAEVQGCIVSAHGTNSITNVGDTCRGEDFSHGVSAVQIVVVAQDRRRSVGSPKLSKRVREVTDVPGRA